MKKILLNADSYDSFWAHYSFVNDKNLFEEFKKYGFEVFTNKECEPEEADIIIFLEAKSIVSDYFFFKKIGVFQKLKFIVKKIFLNQIKKEFRDKVLVNGENIFRDKSYLLVLEGVLDAPENHSPDLVHYVKKVFTWNSNLVNDINFIKILCPQQCNWPEVSEIPFSKKKLVVSISANKRSSNNLELYSERRKLINYLDINYSCQFDFYGFGWDVPHRFYNRFAFWSINRYNSYCGVAEDKAIIFSSYKFAIIYENASVPGYVTEKIFDCLRSKCIPIYLGAPNIDEIVPSNLFIDRRRFSDNTQLINYLLDMEEVEYSSYLSRIDNYLLSDHFKSHLSISLAKLIIRNI
jgi:hypothetical protein